MTVTGVAGGSEVFSADNMGAGTNISREQIDAFASINRNLQDYVRLDPRIAQTDKARNEISRRRPEPALTTRSRIDGVNTSDTFGLESNNLPTPTQPISMDTIEAIKVDVANYDVTITGGTGAVINAVTKSGTNEFHGSVYGTLPRQRLVRREREPAIRPATVRYRDDLRLHLRRPDDQGSLFFFANYEKYTGKERSPATQHRPDRLGRDQHRQHHPGADRRSHRHLASDVWGFDPGDAEPASRWTPTTEEYRHQAGLEHQRQPSRQLPLQQVRAEPGRSRRASARQRRWRCLALSVPARLRPRVLHRASCSATGPTTSRPKFKVSYRDYSAVRTPLADLPAIRYPHRQSTS